MREPHQRSARDACGSRAAFWYSCYRVSNEGWQGYATTYVVDDHKKKQQELFHVIIIFKTAENKYSNLRK
jgi:hypothetical protein